MDAIEKIEGIVTLASGRRVEIEATVSSEFIDDYGVEQASEIITDQFKRAALRQAKRVD